MGSRSESHLNHQLSSLFESEVLFLYVDSNFDRDCGFGRKGSK